MRTWAQEIKIIETYVRRSFPLTRLDKGEFLNYHNDWIAIPTNPKYFSLAFPMKIGYIFFALEYLNFLKWGQIERGSYMGENNFCSFKYTHFALTPPHLLWWSFRVKALQGIGRVMMILRWAGSEPVPMERTVESRSWFYPTLFSFREMESWLPGFWYLYHFPSHHNLQWH